MMTLSTKARYAVRILVFLARREDTAPAKKQEISEAVGISPDYVEQILIRLKAGGLARSHRGKKGGFSLARTPDKISVMDVIESTDGPLEIVPCLSSEECDRRPTCPTRPVWKQATEAMVAVFKEANIAGLTTDACKREKLGALTFEI